MQILGLLGMYFDGVVVFVTKFSLLFRLALAILCRANYKNVNFGVCLFDHYSMARANLNKSEVFLRNTTAASNE